ncbi:hypothetical protein [Pelagovum pacificum]|nr:hypothetical protein [Pelagovum pacificum]
MTHETDLPWEELRPQILSDLRQRRALLHRVGDDLTRMLDDLNEEADATEPRQLVARSNELTFAVRKMIEIMEKFDDWNARNGGALAGNRFDADAARAAIGRRLDRLRAAGGAGELPVGAD